MRNDTKLVVAPPSGDKVLEYRMPISLGWHAARGIAQGSHNSVVLMGKKGFAAFASDGAGIVYWKDGQVSKFSETTVVAI